MHDSRTSERTPLHYTMKTPARHSPAPGSSQTHSHSHSHSQSYTSHAQSMRSNIKQQAKSSTPVVSSPRLPYSVGQSHPPKSSPRVSEAQARAPSPNYFGLIVESANDTQDSSGPARDNWSPSSSSVKSFAAAIPKQVPLDANPDFEAFRKQADLNRGSSGFALSTAHYALPPTSNPNLSRPKPTRWHTHASDTGSEAPFGPISSFSKDRPASRMDVDQDSLHDSAYVSSDSKRNSESSLQAPPMSITNLPRFDSPQAMDPSQHRTSLTRAEDRDPRLSVMEHKLDPPTPAHKQHLRSTTLPPKMEGGQPSMITGAQLTDMMKNMSKDRLLILDIRSSQNYAISRIEGALNLCIPTTLLKRATFNIQKLQQTFQKGPDSEKFSRWSEMDVIVVYDAHSSDKRDAVTAQNMIKKFTNEGYNKTTCIVRGGFNQFQEAHSEFVDRRTAAEIAGKTGAQNGCIAPVIGGVVLPGNNNPNPFFSNIRQNMDLADGVGQFDVARPAALESPSLPKWLREAASQPDHGKKVSEKFLHIEVEEQTRMREAYSAFNPGKDKQAKVQLCGVEKGVKNRYKDILPFEHARVKLQDKPQGTCDYVNASHLKASRSNKRYIATQGPLPATFEDFWSVIWEQDVRVVVMLTAESEGGQLKCHPYWKGRDFGAIRLKPLSEKKVSLDLDKHRSESHATAGSHAMGDAGRRRAATTTTLESSTPTPQPLKNSNDTPYVIVRKFALSHTSHPFAPIREITHLHFPSWPDFGTPAQPSHLLALVELANVMQRAALPVETASVVGPRGSSIEHPAITWYDEPEADARARPMLVHCSAGCGRTGTFCTVDSVIDMMKRQRQARATHRGRDHEGDVTMGESGQVSPQITHREMNFEQLSQRRSSLSRPSQEHLPPVDTSWLNNDNLDLIQKTVEDFREQRLSMVQSLRQFVLCYETILEWVTRMNEKTANMSAGRARSGSLQQS